MEKFLKPIEVKIFYDKNLEKITGKDSETATISEGLSFAYFLNFIFSSYPKIQKEFSQGELTFSLNGKKPTGDYLLKDGDELKIQGVKIEDIRKGIELQLSKIIQYYQIDITFGEIKNLVFNEDGQEDFNELTEIFAGKIDDLDKLNAVLEIVNGVWNYFPHKSLGGLSPMEKIKLEQPNNSQN